MKSILIIEDDIIIASDLKGILEDADYMVCGILDGSESIESEIARLNPDIIISDIFLRNGRNALTLLLPVQRTNPFPLLFISSYYTSEVIEELLQIKHDGYIIKPFTDEQILASVNLVHKKINIRDHKLLKLTPAEKQITMFTVNGLTTKDIAEILNRSEHTIITHKKSVFHKLHVRSVQQLIKYLAQ